MLECFPDPYPDEILYSVWARYSDQVRYPTKQAISHTLFGKSSGRRIRAILDLPCHLGHFFDNLPLGHQYTIDFIINYHTLLPLYAPFLPPERVSSLREQMITGNGSGLYRRLGIASSRIPSLAWLRYCPACVEEDRKKFGECYWHRLHQVLGVELCPKHAVFLEQSTVQTRGYVDLGIISAESAIKAITPRRAASSPGCEALMEVAINVSRLLEYPFTSPGLPFLREQYLALLAKRGFETASGSVRIRKLLEAFAAYYPAELLFLFHCEASGSRSTRKTWLNKLTHSSERTLHPLQHILAIHFLGSDVEAFLHERIMSSKPFGEGPWPCFNPVCENYQQKCIPAYQAGRHPKKGCVVGRFTCTCGFTYSLYPSTRMSQRPKVLAYGKVWEAKLRKLWLDPTTTCLNISHCLGVALPTVRLQAVKLQLPFPRSSVWADSFRKSVRRPNRVSSGMSPKD
jgi:Tn7-like transposition protein D/TniQ protein